MDSKPKSASDLAPPTTLPEWRTAYEDALREPSKNNLFTRVEVAEAAMLIRLESLNQTPKAKVERVAIEGALRNLQLIKEQILNFPCESLRPQSLELVGANSETRRELRDPKMSKQFLRDSLIQLFESQTVASAVPSFCGDCGSLLATFDCKFWLDGTEESWTVPIAYCAMCRPDISYPTSATA